MKRAQFALLGLVALTSLASADPDPDPSYAPEPEHKPTPFDRGRFSLGVGGGSQTTLGSHYYVFGASFGYYVLDGLDISLGGLEAFGSGPNIAKLSPELRYVVQPLVGKSPVVPYVATFYNHWFVADDYADVDTIGGRAGLLFVSGRAILGLGVVVEHIISTCDTDCTTAYPDVTVGFSL